MHEFASPLLIASFLGVVLVTVVALVTISSKVLGPLAARRTAIILLSWLSASAGLSLLGFTQDFSFPPLVGFLLLCSLATALVVGLSAYGRKLSQSVPLWMLIGINAFRLPLEFIMHRAYLDGVMPVQMSYSGQNYDIVSGGLALLIALFTARSGTPVRLARLFNVVGFALLLNIVVIAVLSMPSPFRSYTNEPANIWVGFFPFVWLPTFLVPVALLSHVLLLRRVVTELSQQQWLQRSKRQDAQAASKLDRNQ